MARIVEAFHSFICPPTHLSMIGMNHTCLCLCLPSLSWSSFTNFWEMEGSVGLATTMLSKQSAQDRYVMEITTDSCWNCQTSLGYWSVAAMSVELMTSRALSGWFEYEICDRSWSTNIAWLSPSRSIFCCRLRLLMYLLFTLLSLDFFQEKKWLNVEPFKT